MLNNIVELKYDDINMFHFHIFINFY